MQVTRARRVFLTQYITISVFDYMRILAYIVRMKYDDAVVRAKILKALANPVRLLLVDTLSRGDCCVNELLPLAQVDQSSISRHLALLKHVGIVTERRAGTRIIHHLECPCILQALECTEGVLRKDATRKARQVENAEKP